MLVSQSLFQGDDALDLQLITVVVSLDSNDQTHTGCMVVGSGPLAAGGTLNCISAEALTQTIFTNVDGVTINVGDAGTPTIVNVPSDDDPTSNDDAIFAVVGDDGTVGITIDTSNGTLTGADRGILAYSAGTGAISITTAAVTGTTGDGIYAGLANDAGTGAVTVIATGAVSGGTNGISAYNAGTGGISITDCRGHRYRCGRYSM